MPAVADLHSQIASVMEVLANAAVAEICKAVEDGYAVVNLEMSRSLKENECLRRRVKLLELQVSRYRAEQRLKAPDGSGAGRLFPGVRLLQHRHGRDTPPGPSFQSRPRFLNRPQQKSPATDLDQDPNQEVVTSSKIESREPEENSDLIIVKVEGSASVEDTNNNKDSSTSLDKTSEQQAQSSHTESQESQENSSGIWKSEEQVVKLGDKNSPSNEEPHLYPIPKPVWQNNNNAKSEQLLNSDPQNKNVSSRRHSTTSSNSQEVYPSADLISHLRREDFLPAALSVENHPEETGEVLAFNVTQNASSLFMQPDEPANIQNRQITGPIFNESPDLPHLCSFCPHQFAQKKELIWHERIHRAKKPYQCDQCGKISVSFCHLKRHKLVHTGERPYPCAHCGKKFTTFNNLKVHQSVHTGERKFRCETCGKTYAFHSNLIRHQAVHTKVLRCAEQSGFPVSSSQ